MPPGLLLRTIQAAPGPDAAPVPVTPEQLPPHVDDALLARILRTGRPVGDEGVFTLGGLGCPTIMAGPAAAQPLLFVHGLGHDSWDWAPLFVRCSKKALCVTFDLPGFGLADKPTRPPHGRWELRVWVDALMEAARLMPRPPVVVASSLGGHLAVLAALEEPALFHKLVLLSPGGFVEVPHYMQAAVRAHYAIDAIAKRPEAELLATSRRIFAVPGNPLDDQLASRKLAVRRSDRSLEFAVPFSGVVDDVFRHVVINRFPKLLVPTLMISAEKDVVVPAHACADAARKLGCRFELMQGIGHTPHLEAPDATAALILPFALSPR